tara:strand:+ start:1840 stop:3297 length:1458 start_codon:yes stop_codon:yes gene_type:complete
MLSSIRKFSKSFLAKIFVAIIALPFLLWGMGDIFRSGKQNVLVEINDKEKISTKEFIDYIQKINLSSDEIKRVGKSKILDEILTNYISEKIISLETERKKLELSDQGLMKILLNDKNFMKDGKFSETKYEKFMLTSGFTKPMYEKRIRDIELKGQLLTFYSGGIKLPNFIVDEMYKKENSTKSIDYIDLNKIYSKKTIEAKSIKDFYEKNKNFFKEKFKKFRYLELSPEILIGKKDFDESYFKKIDSIENQILDGKKFDLIISGNEKKVKNIEFVNSTKAREDRTVLKEMEDKLFNKLFSIKSKNKPEFINLDEKYYIAEVLNEKDVSTTLNDSDLKKTIVAQLKVLLILKENKKLIDDIESKKFNKKNMIEFAKNNNVEVNKAKIKNIKDVSKFNIAFVEEIYRFNKNQIFLLSDSLLKENYLVRIYEEERPKIKIDSKNYEKNLKKANAEYIKKVYKSYDKYVNAKYKIDVNNKVFERIKNSF